MTIQLEALTEAIRGEILTAGTPGYDEARALWNGMIDKRPGAIVRCTGVADVIATVNFAREQDLPLAIKAKPGKLTIKLSGKLDRQIAQQPDRYAVKSWDIRRSKDYGSPHINERQLKVATAVLLEDGQTVELTIPDIQETRCMEIKYSLKSIEGREIHNTIHNTIHALGK